MLDAGDGSVPACPLVDFCTSVGEAGGTPEVVADLVRREDRPACGWLVGSVRSEARPLKLC